MCRYDATSALQLVPPVPPPLLTSLCLTLSVSLSLPPYVIYLAAPCLPPSLIAAAWSPQCVPVDDRAETDAKCSVMGWQTYTDLALSPSGLSTLPPDHFLHLCISISFLASICQRVAACDIMWWYQVLLWIIKRHIRVYFTPLYTFLWICSFNLNSPQSFSASPSAAVTVLSPFLLVFVLHPDATILTSPLFSVVSSLLLFPLPLCSPLPARSCLPPSLWVPSFPAEPSFGHSFPTVSPILSFFLSVLHPGHE